MTRQIQLPKESRYVHQWLSMACSSFHMMSSKSAFRYAISARKPSSLVASKPACTFTLQLGEVLHNPMDIPCSLHTFVWHAAGQITTAMNVKSRKFHLSAWEVVQRYLKSLRCTRNRRLVCQRSIHQGGVLIMHTDNSH